MEEVVAPHILGIGGVFTRAGDKDGLGAWYNETLGIDNGEYGKDFMWQHADGPGTKAGEQGRTVWSLFDRESTYFEGPYMINYIVCDMDALLIELDAKGIAQLKPREDYEYGSFAWIKDPEGRWIELWQPIEAEVGEE